MLFVFPFFSSLFQAPWTRSYQVYLSKWWDPCVSPDFPIKLTFLDLSFLFQHVELLTNSLRGGFQVYCLSPRFSLRKPRHYNINLDVICWFLVFHGPGQIELLSVAWILQETGDAGSMACTRSQVKVDYFIIPYTPRFIRLYYLICTRNVIPIILQLQMTRRWDRSGDGWLKLGFRWRWQGLGIILSIVFPCAFLIFSLTFSVPWHRWLEHDGCCLCFFAFNFFFFFTSSPFNLQLRVHRNYFVCSSKYFRRQVTDHYCVDFLGKWRVFWFQSLFRVSLFSSIHHETSSSNLPFELADLGSLFILLPCFRAGSPLAVKTLFC